MAEPANEGGQLPLSALLSQVLVAFIIECDNEFERQVPHRTSDHGSTASRGGGPWLVSMAMWWTCMRFVGEEGISVGELGRRADTGTNRWRARFGGPAIGALREALERLTGDPAQSPLRLTEDPARSPLFAGLEPPPGGWRGSVRRPATLPYCPMVLHRGGFPDGS